MGEAGKDALREGFEGSIKLEFHGSKVSSDGGLLRQSVFSRLAGYEDTNDAERLEVDPSMRYVVGGRARTKQAAL